MPSVGVFAVVRNQDNEVLCVKLNYGSGNWTLPGGHLEENESPIEGVKREVLEETGCEVEVVNFVGVYSSPEKGDLVLLFRADILKEGSFMPNEEIQQRRFFAADSLPDEMHPWNKKRIHDAATDMKSFLHVFEKEGKL
ncbi:NUDIX hydrolase [Bacillus sp. SCS-153A]|uniref:NUDIX hydrolase n=1 Tax=Rossellomorea sedimentorum TaxID=3115294 RepID=UPI0039058510